MNHKLVVFTSNASLRLALIYIDNKNRLFLKIKSWKNKFQQNLGVA